MTTNVLFMCPHSAGKSLLAATYFRAAAARSGLDVAINVAGPDPDEHNMVNVVAAIEKQGFTIGWHPKLVDAADISQADLVFSIGCERGDLPAGPATSDTAIVDWDSPMLSEDFDGAMNAIHAHAEALARELAGS